MDVFSQNLGFCGIFKNSFSILCSQKKTFLQISLALLLPIGIISQILSVLSPILSVLISNTSEGSSSITIVVLSLIFLLAIISVIILSLLAVAAIVTAVAQTYLQIPLHFPSVIKRTPRILKKLFVTFLWCSLLTVVYNVALLVLLFLVLVFLRGSTLGLVILVVLLIFYLVGSLYVSVLVNVAYVATVLEEGYGRAAIVRSRDLLRGKEILAGLILIVVGLFAVGIAVGLSFAGTDNVVVQVVVWVAYCLVIVAVGLLLQVIYTVLYITCKFFHREAIDVSLLASHLDAYLGHYVVLKAEDSHA